MRYIARQPIFDRSATVIGYELLYRSDATGPANVTDGDQATFSVLYDLLVTFGLHSMVQETRGWVNVTPSVLGSGGHLLASPDKVILELHEETAPTPELLDLVAQVRAAGYTVALDDFVLGGPHDVLLDLVDIVKLELPAIPPGRLAADIAAVRRPGLTVLVEKVETAEQLSEAMAAGADLFQGFFFSRPQVHASAAPTSGTQVVLAVLARLNDASASAKDLTSLVSTDLALAQKVLQSVNSGFHALQHRVGSLRHAIVLLGPRNLRQLVTLVVLAGASGKPAELSRQALIRAEMTSELVRGPHGKAATLGDQEAAFTVGLLSTLDAFTDMELADVASRLSLSDNLYDALVHQTGRYGAALRTTLSYEADDAATEHDEATVTAYLTAVARADARWAEILEYHVF